jgi:hypothetical protein
MNNTATARMATAASPTLHRQGGRDQSGDQYSVPSRHPRRGGRATFQQVLNGQVNS